jgi:hypothetical protein
MASLSHRIDAEAPREAAAGNGAVAARHGLRRLWHGVTAADWLDAPRLRVYPRIVVAIYAVAGLAWLATSHHLVDRLGKPIGYDFITFWSAARLAAAGAPAAAYDLARLFAEQRSAVPGLGMPFAWHYPPTFLLVVLPLAALPYLWGWVLWLGATLSLFLGTVARATRQQGALWLALAFPGTFVNGLHGQNGFLTTALMGGGLMLLERRPVLAGVLFGLTSWKPQFGLLLPIVLVATRRWSALAAAAATTLALAALSVAALGIEPWQAFVDNRSLLRLVLEQGYLPWAKMPTAFVAARLLGAPVGASYALQAIVAVIVVAAVVALWRSRAEPGLKAAGLVVGSLMLSPYGFDYDLAMLALPIAWLGRRGLLTAFLPGEKVILLLAWLAPVLVSGVAAASGLQLGPLILAALLWAVWRRACRERVAPA